MSALDPRIRDIELDLLLDGIFRTYHYDFRSYARPSLERRIEQALSVLELPTITALLDRIVHDPQVFSKLLLSLTIQVSSFFRDPQFWLSLREKVLPHLRTYPFLRIWVAGCGQGEEAYSMAILLHEEGLLENTQIYATDIDARSLGDAKRGVYDLHRFQEFSANYFAAGGKSSLSDYYTTGYSHAMMAPWLREKILFSDHSLATDATFAEVQLITCRNVFIYFEEDLQDRAIGLFIDSLCPRGFLGLGSHESLQRTARAHAFEKVVGRERIYRLRGA